MGAEMILVTAANGNQGRWLVPKLVQAGHYVRACVRTHSSAEQLRTQGAEVMVGDLADRTFLARAMHGAQSVCHVGPTLHPAERSIGFAAIELAREAGVQHFVFSSVLHAITTDLIQHEMKRDIEEYLLSSGLQFTILQPANYMLPFRMRPVFEKGVSRLTWSLERRQSMVDLDDVTDVAALVLGQPGTHAAATYELAAPGHFTAFDIGHVLARVLGHDVQVEQMDTKAFVLARFGEGDPALRDYQTKAARAISARYSGHDFLGNSNVLTWLLDRAPTSFEAFAQRELASFRMATRNPAASSLS